MTETKQKTTEIKKETYASDTPRSNESNLVTRKFTRAIWIAATILDVLLGFRILLKLFAANPGNLFASIVYAVTDFLVYPFQNLVSNPSIGNGILEVTTLIAILVYIFLTWLLIQLVLLIFKR